MVHSIMKIGNLNPIFLTIQLFIFLHPNEKNNINTSFTDPLPRNIKQFFKI